MIYLSNILKNFITKFYATKIFNLIRQQTFIFIKKIKQEHQINVFQFISVKENCQ